MTISKKQVLEAINFLKSIPARKWITDELTLDFDPQHIGKFHCAIGHLAINPASPFYKRAHVNGSKVSTSMQHHDEVFGIKLNRFCAELTGKHLADANNHPQIVGQKTPRGASLKLLRQVYKEM